MKGKLTYKLTSNDEKMGRREMDKVVFFTDKGSVEFNVDKRAEDLNQDNDESKGYLVFKNKKTDFIYKNFAKKSLYFRGLVGKTGYLTADTLLNFKWKITKEKSKIANYNCVKATTKFRGRNYVAWYTEDIALQNGPWKFCGLPGLIIKVADDQNMFSYQLTGIDLKAKFDPKTVAIPSVYANDKAITYKEYMILYKKKLEAFAKLSKVTTSGKDGSYGTVSITLPAEMEKF
ncbi:hypothetical protein GCM10008119_37600 [Pedobacter mendelii]|nr:hypothetical protein GCM10008119_37600 [Pedobacter mendelii]